MELEVYKIKRPKHIIFGNSAYFEQYSGDQLKEKILDYVTPTSYEARLRLHQYPELGYEVREMGLYLAPAKHIDTYVANRLLKGQDTDVYDIVDEGAASYHLSVDGRNRTILTGGCECWGDVINIIHEGEKGDILDGLIVRIGIPNTFDFAGMQELAQFFFGELGPVLYQRSTSGKMKPSIRERLNNPPPQEPKADVPKRKADIER